MFARKRIFSFRMAGFAAVPHVRQQHVKLDDVRRRFTATISGPEQPISGQPASSRSPPVYDSAEKRAELDEIRNYQRTFGQQMVFEITEQHSDGPARAALGAGETTFSETEQKK